ncbi:MAG: hypothetical protein AB1492_05805 [Bacillota bacterium]
MLNVEALTGRLEGYYRARLGVAVTIAGLRPLGDGFGTSVFAYQPQVAPGPLILRVYSPLRG